MAECKLNYTADEINRRLGLLDSTLEGGGGGNAIWSYNMADLTTKTNILGNPILEMCCEIDALIHPTEGECPTLKIIFQISNCQGDTTVANSKTDCIAPSFESYPNDNNKYYCYYPYYTLADVGVDSGDEKLFFFNYIKAFISSFEGAVLDVYTISDIWRSSSGNNWVAGIVFYICIPCSSEEVATSLKADFDELLAQTSKFYILRNNYSIVEGVAN